LDLVKTKNTQK